MNFLELSTILTNVQKNFWALFNQLLYMVFLV